MKTRILTVVGLLIAVLFTAGNEVAAATLYVSQTSTTPTPPYATWDTAAHTIQEAVDAASDGDAVLVAEGEYRLSAQVTINKAILLQSVMGAGQTSLNGQSSGRCLWMSNSLAVVDGFNITKAYGSDESALGGGVVMIGGVLSNCVVIGTSPVNDTRLVYCSSGGLITDCLIDGRLHISALKGGGVYLIDSELRNSTISRIDFQYAGALEGAGVYAISSTISGCVITNNTALRIGGGAYLDGCVMDRCIIAGNQVGQAIIYEEGLGGGIFATNSVIRNSLIEANRALSGSSGNGIGNLPGVGGGVYLSGGSLLNCTVTGNQAASGGGSHLESGVIRNSIIYFNSGYYSNANWYIAGGGSPDHSCTTPDPGGVGNTVADPQFVDPTSRNYRLAPASPCINAGTNEAWMSGATDLDGNPRIFNGTVDLGAWESQTMNTVPVPRVQVENSATFFDQPTVITLDASSGTVILDGAQSSDAENDPLTYTWLVGDPPETIATGARVTAPVPPGSYVFQLQVSDGELAGAASASIAVLTPCHAIAFLNLRIKESSHRKGLKQPLLALLTVSCNSFDKGKVSKGIEHLKAFQAKVEEKLGKVDPAFAELLIHEAQTLIDIISTEYAAKKMAGNR